MWFYRDSNVILPWFLEERDKLQRDIADILEAFEEYKSKTTGAPEKIFELKKGGDKLTIYLV